MVKPTSSFPLAAPSLLITITILLSTLLLGPAPTAAYIPAVPVNDTSQLNFTDSSWLDLKYYGGVYGAYVSYQLRADVDTGGVDYGALVHFQESGSGGAGDNRTTASAWIAMVNCDLNQTGASDTWDIFTLARDRGATAALLYSETAESCLINEDYIQNFEKPVDVFAIKSKSDMTLIQNQFNNTNSSFYYYNFTLLNSSTAVINESISSDTVATKTYLIATLSARNSTGQMEPSPTTEGTQAATSTASKNTNKSLPMIILYVVTGVVTSLFIGVVLTGAIRAIRHPERYGPNADPNHGSAPQTRAHGVGQAILDTFPVVKFNRKPRNTMAYPTYDKDPENMSAYTTLRNSQSGLGMEDLESPGLKSGEADVPIEMTARSSKRRTMESESESFHSAREALTPNRSSYHPPTPPNGINASEPEIAAAARALAAHRLSLQDGPTGQEDDADRAAMVRGATSRTIEEADEGEAESCPICLLEFETGDDVRVLPCQLAHSYHKACIDPWLLEVSSSCPLCRKDFSEQADQTAETSAQGRRRGMSNATTQSEDADNPGTPIGEESNRGQGSRFGRYLAFVRRERRRGEVQSRPVRARRRRSHEQMGPGPF